MDSNYHNRQNRNPRRTQGAYGSRPIDNHREQNIQYHDKRMHGTVPVTMLNGKPLHHEDIPPRKKPQKSQPPKNIRSLPKKPSKLVSVFLSMVAVCFAVIIIQMLREPADSDAMLYFETETAVFETVDVNVQPDGGLLTYPCETENTRHLDIESDFGILIDITSNTVIASKNSTDRMYPASMTKVLTLIVAYEWAKDLDDTFTFDFEIVNDAYLAGASVAGFTTGETVPIRDLLYGTVLPSGADATSALAKYIAGDEAAFAALMNRKAEEIGMKDSHFVTASGLHDDNHYSTARDIALCLEYAIATPELREILGTYTYTTTPTPEHPNGITLYSTMYQKMKGDEPKNGIYVQGGKTGYTPEAHNCLASFAARCESENADITTPRYILVTGGGIGEYRAIWDAINAYGAYID